MTAFNNVVPLSQTSPEKIDAIRDWGKKELFLHLENQSVERVLVHKQSGPKTRKVLV